MQTNNEDMTGTTTRSEAAHRTLLSIDEVADWLGVSVKTVYSMRDRNQAPPAIKVGRRLRWDAEDIQQWLDEHREAV